MAYRDDLEALRTRCAQLQSDLAEVRRQTQTLGDLKQREAELSQLLRDAQARLEQQQRHWSLPVLEDLRIASPCAADWDAMKGDDRVRFCGECQKNVYNLSAMSREEAQQLVAGREGPMCVRLAKRVDGTVVTDDCPVGVRRRRRRRLLMVGVGGGILAAGGLLAGSLLRSVRCVGRTMGEVAPPAELIQGGLQ